MMPRSAPLSLPLLLLLLMVLCYACSLTRLSLWALAKDTHKQAAACPVPGKHMYKGLSESFQIELH